MRGRLNVIKVDAHLQAISADMIGDYQHDRAFRTTFRQYVNNLWLQKDEQLLCYHQAKEAITLLISIKRLKRHEANSPARISDALV